MSAYRKAPCIEPCIELPFFCIITAQTHSVGTDTDVCKTNVYSVPVWGPKGFCWVQLFGNNYANVYCTASQETEI